MRLSNSVRFTIVDDKLMAASGGCYHEIASGSAIEPTLDCLLGVTGLTPPGSDSDLEEELVARLKSVDLIRDEEAVITDRKGRYSRLQSFFQDRSCTDLQEAAERLNSADVTIIGCGGIGNYLSVHLVTLGLNKITVIDDDLIEISNLTRQHLFRESDVGRPKVEVLKAALTERNSRCVVQAHKRHIRSKSDLDELQLGRSSFIVVAADESSVQEAASRFARKHGIPVMPVGYLGAMPTWGPILMGADDGCLGCYSTIQNHADSVASSVYRLNFNHYIPPSIGPINAIAASNAALDVIAFLTGVGTVRSRRRRIIQDLETGGLASFNWEKSLSCSFCNS